MVVCLLLDLALCVCELLARGERSLLLSAAESRRPSTAESAAAESLSVDPLPRAESDRGRWCGPRESGATRAREAVLTGWLTLLVALEEGEPTLRVVLEAGVAGLAAVGVRLWVGSIG